MDELLTLSFTAVVDDQSVDEAIEIIGSLRFDPSATPDGVDPETNERIYEVFDPGASLEIAGVAEEASQFEIRVGNNVVVGGVLVLDTVSVTTSGGDFALTVGYGSQDFRETLTGPALPTSLPPFTPANAFGSSLFLPTVTDEPLRTLATEFVISEGRIGAGVSEAEAQTVAYLYEAALDRNGEIDLGGLNFWIDRREAGLSEVELAAAFLDNAEFIAAFGEPDSLSNRELVEVFYLNVLDREGDAAGIAFWTLQLDNGVGRDQVLLSFATVDENTAESPFVEDLTELSPGEWAFL